MGKKPLTAIVSEARASAKQRRELTAHRLAAKALRTTEHAASHQEYCDLRSSREGIEPAPDARQRSRFFERCRKDDVGRLAKGLL